MKRNTKHCLLRKMIAVASAAVMMISVPGSRADAGASNPASASFGFNVDQSAYRDINWKPRIDFRAQYKGQLIGEATAYYGFARLNAPVVVGSTYCHQDTTMFQITMRGMGSNKKFGYAKHFWIKASNPASCDLLTSVNPQSIAGNVSVSNGTSTTSSYSAGSSSSGISSSITGSTAITSSRSYTMSALEVQNRSSYVQNKVDLKFIYNRKEKKDDWRVFDVYAYNTSLQNASFTYLTPKVSYKRSMILEAAFDIFNSEPSKSASQLSGDPSVEVSVIVIPPLPR